MVFSSHPIDNSLNAVPQACQLELPALSLNNFHEVVRVIFEFQNVSDEMHEIAIVEGELYH